MTDRPYRRRLWFVVRVLVALGLLGLAIDTGTAHALVAAAV
jgi:hypothetical protein